MKATVAKLAIITFICIGFISCGAKEEGATDEHTKKVKLAQDAADSWLELVDSGEYDKTWDEMAQYFKDTIAKEKWPIYFEAARKPFGNLITRTVKSKKYATSVAGAPDGEYVIIQYETCFENKEKAIETVTPMKDNDGKWRVAGYYIK